MTMRWVFDDLFESLGERLSDHLTLEPLDILARHSWPDGSTLDLFGDIDRTCAAIEQFAGAADARGYRRFCQRSQEAFELLKPSFLEEPAPTPTKLALGKGLAGMGAMLKIAPFQSLWRLIAQHVADPRLRQLLGRYATYSGSSPFLSPGPLMIIPHVERLGVWSVKGGMVKLADALREACDRAGAEIRLNTDVASIDVRGDRVAAVHTTSGDTVPADAILFNGDPAALAAGGLGRDVARAVGDQPAADRSLSAITLSATARTSGFDLARHNVFFGADTAAEFTALFERRDMPSDPTIYVCAQDRLNDTSSAGSGAERLLLLINAPAIGDRHKFDDQELSRWKSAILAKLQRHGLELHDLRSEITAPHDFADLFPHTGGALYGRASHGWMASFQRPTARTRIRGLYLAGGGAHPGAGLPMAALSARHAADAIAEDFPFSTSG
jgi:1-hydroxycarotenoid 3,4-desaturase